MAKLIKIALFGNSKSGKTCLLYRFLKNTFPENSSFTHETYCKWEEKIINGAYQRFFVWDVLVVSVGLV